MRGTDIVSEEVPYAGMAETAAKRAAHAAPMPSSRARSATDVLTELAVAEERLGAWKHALSVYSGSNDAMYSTEIRKAADLVNRLKSELRERS